MKKFAKTEKNRLFVKRVKQSICLLLFMLCSSFILSSCSDEVNEPQNTGWQDYTADVLEQKLKEACGNESVDVNSLVTSLKVNNNVEDAFATADKMQVAVKQKGEDMYTIYPIHMPEDPFAYDENQVDSQDAINHEDNNVINVSESNMSKANSPRIINKAGSAGKVAIFNYFSHIQLGDDAMSSRTTQNQMINFMINELDKHDFEIEYYGYDKMTLDNLEHVIGNQTLYKAVVIISHGFSDGKNSYFAIGEEYNGVKAANNYLVNLDNDNYSVPLKYRIWNQGWSGFSGRKEFVVPVQNMALGSNVLLYFGSCDALSNQADINKLNQRKSSYLGWDGINSTAQAHATLLFHKLMRGKHILDALDIDETKNPYYHDLWDQKQTDTWTYDPQHESTKLVYNVDNLPTAFGGGFWAKFAPKYHEVNTVDGKTHRVILYIMNTKKEHPVLADGCYFNKDKKFKLKFEISGDYINTFGDYIWIKATPLRADREPIIYKVKKNKLKKGITVDLDANGVWDFSAAIDENFTTELLPTAPLVVVYAKPFKDNGIPTEDGDYEYVDLGLPSGTLWATMNVGADSPEDYGDYFAWGETEPKDYYNWSNYKWCNGTYNSITKYCNNGKFGIVDNKTELDLDDDAAYVNMGPGWRMPSTEQIQELIDNCNSKWTKRNDVKGVLLTSKKNGASLFLPAAGLGEGSSEYNLEGTHGYYSSRSLTYFFDMTINGYEAYRNMLLRFYYEYLESNDGPRCAGHSVRAVRVPLN
ncbi:MAG: hypothetical protein IJG81_04250 [Muribaculaceae bacterium]|nr:hypothetical protein [Muribaculaceae bacterium]